MQRGRCKRDSAGGAPATHHYAASGSVLASAGESSDDREVRRPDRPNILTIPSSSRPEVVLRARPRAVIEADALRRAPHEACGLLAGHLGDGLIHVLAAVPLDNLAEDPQRAFRVDPLAILLDPPSRSGNWVGVYHSHPADPPTPSTADLAAAWPGFLQIVTGRGPDAGRAWCSFVMRERSAGATRLRLRNTGTPDPDPAQNRSV